MAATEIEISEETLTNLQGQIETVEEDINTRLAHLRELVELIEKLYTVKDGKEREMSVSINRLSGETFQIRIKPSMSVYELKTLIAQESSIPECQMRLIYAGKQLEDGKGLHLYHVREGCTIHLIPRLRGGMYDPSSGQADLNSSNEDHLKLAIGVAKGRLKDKQKVIPQLDERIMELQTELDELMAPADAADVEP